jgi:manganese/zinc/iron transport system ATP- binding protein
MGRYGELGWLRRPRAHDREIVLEALDQVGLLAHKDSSIGALSGGQQQRVFFARALAQQAELYLLDEPFVNIDLVTEHSLVRLLQNMAHADKTIVVIHHDVHTVRHYFDSALLLNARTIAHGPAMDVITSVHLQSAYGQRYMSSVTP